MDKSQKVASSVIYLIMSQILIDLITQGIQINNDNGFPDLPWTNKSLTKSLLLPGTNKKLDMDLLIWFNLITFVHLKVQPNNHQNSKLHNIYKFRFLIKMAIITYTTKIVKISMHFYIKVYPLKTSHNDIPIHLGQKQKIKIGSNAICNAIF